MRIIRSSYVGSRLNFSKFPAVLALSAFVWTMVAHSIPTQAGGFDVRYESIKKSILALSAAGRNKPDRESAERAVTGLRSTLDRLTDELEAEVVTEKAIQDLKGKGVSAQSEHSAQDISRALNICQKNQRQIKKLIELTRTESTNLERFAKSLKPSSIDAPPETLIEQD